MIGFYGFIYLTINLITGMMYIGKRKYDKHNKWKKYLGSGKYFKNAVKKYGKENFVRIILEDCKTKKELSDREREYIEEFDCVSSDLYYNLCEGGEGGNISQNNEDRKRKVIAVDLGIEFNSIDDAASYFGVSISNISFIVQHYHDINGHEIWLSSDMENYKPLEYFKQQKQSNYISAQEKKKRKVILFPDNIIFKNVDECLIHTQGTRRGLESALYNKTDYHGFDVWWYDDIDNYIPFEERLKNKNQNRTNGIQKISKAKEKKVLCKETGTIYESGYKAAEAIGCKSKEEIGTSIRRGTKCHGYTFEYIK